MYHQVDKVLLNPAQFGRPQDASISKVLHNLVCHLTRTPMGQFESDATAFFYCEIMQFVLTCYETTGVPLGPLRMWEQVLYNVIHRVKTGFGTSTDGYSFTDDSPIYGPGQGSKGGPGSCSTATSILIDAMAKLCYGLNFTDPAQQEQYTTTVNMFVDDASNCTNKFLDWLHVPPDFTDIVVMPQHDSQTWERLLWTSGGLLNLLKCTYYVLTWIFGDEGHARCVPKRVIPLIRLTSGNQPGTAPVHQLQFDKTHKYLGNYLSTGMHMQDAYSDLSKKAPLFAARLLRSDLSKQDAWIAYFAVFVPSMTYSLPVSHHSKKKLCKLQSIPTRAVLMKTGFNRNTLHRVVFGPSRYGGLGFGDLFIKQGISQVELLIRHLRADSPQGQLLCIAIAWWQLVVGVSYPLLQ
jgi:hypothetical protein